MHPQRHVSVSTKDNGDVTLKTDDGIVRWDAGGSFGELSWVWKESGEHTTTISSGMGEYPRTKLSAEQEELFAEEIQNWPDNGRMAEHDVLKHGEPKCVPSLIAQMQEGKTSTPVRPCLNYRMLNECIVSHPGLDAPAYGKTLRKWCQAGPPDSYQLIDISKAYLRV